MISEHLDPLLGFPFSLLRTRHGKKACARHDPRPHRRAKIIDVVDAGAGGAPWPTCICKVRTGSRRTYALGDNIWESRDRNRGRVTGSGLSSVVVGTAELER